MGTKSAESARKLIVAIVWIVIISLTAFAYKFFVKPYYNTELENVTSSESKYSDTINLDLDSFSGYSILRSEYLTFLLGKHGIKLNINNDNSDISSRIKNLKNGKTQMAVFTIDSLISAGNAIGEIPGTIIFIIDETNGADAILAPANGIKSLQDLNDPEVKIVLTPDSPSEFLTKVIIAHFNLPLLSKNWISKANGAKDVYKKLVNDTGSKNAYVLWEPYVSKAVTKQKAKILLSSEKLKGYIVDVLVVSRKFLQENPETVHQFAEDYFTASFKFNQKEKMIDLLKKDCAKNGMTDLSLVELNKLSSGIQWKNTLENYAHFGIIPQSQTSGLQHIEDMIINITDVLLKTDSINSSELKEKPNSIIYNEILKRLYSKNFHPGKKMNLIKDLGMGMDDLNSIKPDVILKELSVAEWNSLTKVGELKLNPISFGRGGSRINVQSKRELNALAKKLKSWPNYYLIITGHSRSDGDPEANLRLAESRATAAMTYLKQQGINSLRIKAKSVKPTGSSGAHQSVTFVFAQKPY